MNSGEILITGATGNLGKRLVRQLAISGTSPRALVRTREKAEAISPFADPVMGDLLDPKSLPPAFKGVSRVFILGQPTAEMEALERNAIDAAVAAGVKRIVYLSNFTAREGSELKPNHIHGVHERLVASLGLEWTVLGPTRYMTSMPFDWESVLKRSLLLEAGGTGTMTCIDPDEVAEIAAKTLTEDGHQGKIYRLTSRDSFTAASLAKLLSNALERDLHVFEGAPETAPMSKYFAMVAAGLYIPMDTAEKVLGRKPRSYAEWLDSNLPRILSMHGG